MKAQYALIGILITSVAHSADFGLYANSVSAHNIVAAQHEIANRVFTPMGKKLAQPRAQVAEKTVVEKQDPDVCSQEYDRCCGQCKIQIKSAFEKHI